MFWHFIYKAGHHINSTSLMALPSPCPTIREVFDDGHFLLTPCSCTLFFAWAISSSAERGYSFYLHLRGCSHKTAWPGQMTPPLHPGLPGSYQSQRVCKNFFLWDSGSSAGTCGKPVSHYSLVLSLSQWSMQSTFLVLGGYQFSPISLEKKQKQNIQYVHKQYDFVTYSNIKYQVKKQSLQFFNGEQLNLKPLRAIQYLHCSTRLHWQDKLVL